MQFLFRENLIEIAGIFDFNSSRLLSFVCNRSCDIAICYSADYIFFRLSLWSC